MAAESHLMHDSPRPMSRRAALLGCGAAVAAVPGCATERTGVPSIAAAPRTDLRLSRPVMGAVFDGRPTPGDAPVAPTLQRDLARIYGPSIAWRDYFAQVPPGEVAMRFRIVALGSVFGSRIISAAAVSSATARAQGSATGPWGTVVAQATAQQTAFTGAMAAEGWWNGAAWVDIEIEDNRPGRRSRLTIPAVAEHRESNTWGYGSGDRAARVAWERVSAQVIRVVDGSLRMLRDAEASSSPGGRHDSAGRDIPGASSRRSG